MRCEKCGFDLDEVVLVSSEEFGSEVVCPGCFVDVVNLSEELLAELTAVEHAG